MGDSDFKKIFQAPKLAPTMGAQISHEQFKYITSLIFKQAGIHLDDNKMTMVQSRISRRLKSLELETYEEYIKYLETNKDKELEQFINALTTNKTDFFREIDHFNYLKQVFLPNLVKQKKHQGTHTIFIWSAACSAGHEVYTLAMIMEEFIKINPGFDYKILGSDIDTDILEKAQNGVYPEEQLLPVAKHYLAGNFQKGSGTNSGFHKASEKLKRNVKFRRFNLIDKADRLPLSFDIIFLRNVLIYFPPEVIQLVIDKLSSHLKTGGHFFIGHSETLNGITHDFETLGAATFRKKGSKT